MYYVWFALWHTQQATLKTEYIISDKTALSLQVIIIKGCFAAKFLQG